MKKLFFFSLLFVVSASMVLKPAELRIGDKAPFPDTKMTDISGKSYSFNEVKKKNGLLVVFSCNTCPWVIKNQDVATAGYNYALSKNVGVIVLNSNEAQRGGDDSKEAMKQYAKDQNYK